MGSTTQRRAIQRRVTRTKSLQSTRVHLCALELRAREICFLHLGDLEYVRGELALADKRQLPLFVGQSHWLIGHILYMQEKYHESLEHYHQALDLFTQLNNQAYLAHLYEPCGSLRAASSL